MIIRYAYKLGWGYIAEVYKNGNLVESVARGDCWSDMSKFETGDMPVRALKESTVHLISLLRKQYNIEAPAVFDASLLPPEYR